MWIRSQDKKLIIKINNSILVDVNKLNINYAIYGDNLKIGVYSSYKKAMYVLDMIEKYNNDNLIYDSKKRDYIRTNIFQMPKDSEVNIC